MFLLEWVVMSGLCAISLVMATNYVGIVTAEESLCASHDASCESCISFRQEKCVWCPAEAMSARTSRCQSEVYNNTNPGWCKAIVESLPTKFNVLEDFNIDLGKEKKIHFSPQKIMGEIRPSAPLEFDVTYMLGRRYPLDVYFIVDASYTMYLGDGYNSSPHTILIEKAEEVQEQVQHITSNVQMGLGLFMEKPVWPYAAFDALSYDHVISLTKNITKFRVEMENKINGLGTMGNNEDPEAGLDALLQAMLCRETVGWRDLARRIIVLCTDAVYHSAGDGKMLGILTPSDETCRMDNNTYKDASKFDYPSVGLINKVAVDNNFQILFIASENVRRDYELLSKQIQGSSYVPLEGNFMSKISDEYEKSLRHPQLVVTAPSYVEVTITPACDKKLDECKVDLDQTKTVRVKLDLKSCPNNGESTVEIGLLGIDSKLVIKVKPLCNCQCENGKHKPNVKCNDHGSLQCGVCICNREWRGETCNCTGNNDIETDSRNCKFKDDSEICSGRGICSCGQCINCVKSSGRYCEYSDDDCPKFDGTICAGHGKCNLAQCICDDAWTKPDCSCPRSNKDCIPPYQKEECFGNGDCECGVCRCKNYKAVTYQGLFCQSTEARCPELNEIVKCLWSNRVSGSKAPCGAHDIIEKFKTKNNIDDVEQGFSTLCLASTDSAGLIKYRYYDYSFGKTPITIQEELEYPGLPVHVWAAIGGTIGSVVLVGLLTLVIWKILIDRRDAKEYEAFEKEIKSQQLIQGENGVYVPAHSIFENPMYNNMDL